jgi:glycine/D-amino acid oxidase-like deaminating enzyme
VVCGASLDLTTAAPLSPEYAPTPYWWDGVDAPASSPPAPGPASVTEADVAVVGAGYTGLAAAWELARHERHVVVVDTEDIGRGASARNGGMVHPGTKHDLATMLALPHGRALWDDTVAAFEGVVELTGELGLDCDWRRSGHLELAHHPRLASHLRTVADAYASIGEEARFVGPGDLAAEIGSDRFAGGLLVARSGSLHPAKLVGALARAALEAGAELHSHTEAQRVERDGAAMRLETSRGTIRAREVIVATDGTTGRRPVPWLGRRILGIGSFIIATEPLDAARATSVSPAGRMFFDTKNFLNYWRLTPDSTRVLFGGRTSFAPTTVEKARDHLYGAMVRIHPNWPVSGWRGPGGVWSGSPTTACPTWAGTRRRAWSTRSATAAPGWRCPPISAGPSGAGCAVTGSSRPSRRGGGPSSRPRPTCPGCCPWPVGGTRRATPSACDGRRRPPSPRLGRRRPFTQPPMVAQNSLKTST